MRKFLFFWALLAMPVSADELTLKDGRKIEWSAIRDLGDTYEVETPRGLKVIFKKDEVEMFVQTKPVAALTGATFTFDKSKKLETVDLLRAIDLKRDIVTAAWRLNAQGLSGEGSGSTHAKIHVPVTPPAEYDLTIVAQRTGGMDDLGIGLVGGGNQVVLFLDAAQGTVSGPGAIDGKGPAEAGLAKNEKFFEGKPRTIVCMVRKEALIVQVDGKDYIVWKADWTKVSVPRMLAVPKKDVLFLTAFRSSFQISRMALSYPK